MYGLTSAAALLGLSVVANARPLDGPPSGPPASAVAFSAAPSAFVSGSAAPSASASAFPTLASVVASSGVAAPTGGSQNGFKFPLSNGFPNIKNPSPQLDKIEKQAGGTLPNGAPPPSIHGDSEVSLGFIAFNELFEVAFFTELIQNITLNKPGYTAQDIPIDRDLALRTLKVVLAQEELHELNANGAFNKFTGKTIEPCTYIFPVDNFVDAITLASTFTDVVLSTLPDIQTVFADAGDNGLIRGVGSVIGQEGEQNGFYRQILGKIPPQLPFLTGGARDFAFSAILQSFVVPGSCPSQGLLEAGINGGAGLTEFGVLNVLTKDLSLEDVKADFSIQTVDSSNTKSYYESHKGDKLFVTYINQQNVPVSVPVEDLSFSGNAIDFKASFPGKSKDLNGLTIAAVTNSKGPFSTPDDVAADTLFGPGLIEIN
jgi:hypothetical protein